MTSRALHLKHEASGQAAAEFAIVAMVMLLLFCLLVHFSRALYDMEVLSGLSRQGSNLASRGSALSDAAAAVIAGDSPLDLSDSGEVIITSVTNINRTDTITGQVSLGRVSQPSKIGTGVGSRANVPAVADTMLGPDKRFA